LIGFYLLLVKKKKGMGFATMTIGLLWAYLSVKVVIPYIRMTSGGTAADYRQLGLYAHIGHSFSEIIKNLLFHPQKVWESIPCPKFVMLNNLIYLLVPLGFASLASPLIFLIAIPEFFLQSFSTVGLQYLLVSAYPAPIIPFVIISGIYGVERMIRWKIASAFSFAIYILSLSLLSNFYFSFPALRITTDVGGYKSIDHKTLLSIPLDKDAYQFPEQAKVFFEIQRIIPEDAVVSAPSDIGSYLSGRKTFFQLTEYEKADCVILNTSPTTWVDIDLVFKTLNRLLEDKNFRLIFNREGLFLFVKKGYEEVLLDKVKMNLSSASPRLHLIMASIYSSGDQIDEAIKEYRLTIKGYSKEGLLLHKDMLVNLHNELAAIFYKKNEFDSAIFELKKIIELNPGHIEARKNLASFYFLKGEMTNAEVEFKEILRLDPENPYAKEWLKKIIDKD
jgi:tetratricopeptide (TPR) repeat protein